MKPDNETAHYAISPHSIISSSRKSICMGDKRYNIHRSNAVKQKKKVKAQMSTHHQSLKRQLS
jgi:hypothetical protein